MRRSSVIVLSLALLPVLSLSLHGQENPVFAPFVSQIDAEVRNNFIRLSWKDAQDIKGPVFVYRSETPFSALSVSTLPAPVEIPYGTGSFLDEAEKPGTYHYLAAASDETGRKYTLSIPYSNTISVTVGAESVPDYAPPGTAASRTAQTQAAVPAVSALPALEELKARPANDAIIITFSGADPAKNLILYRSVKPLRRTEDLLSAVIIRQQLTSPYTDYPVPGVPYYYAAVYEEELGGGLSVIRPGRNATTEPAEIAQDPRLARGLRSMPLPEINFSSDPDPVSLSPAASMAAAALRRSSPGGVKTEAEVFPEDLEKDAAGETYQLRSIVQGSFCHYQWQKASDEFRRFLSLPREDLNRARARFYLGQVYYFQGKHREALFEFLSAQEKYPVESKSWLDAALLKLSAGR